MPRPSAAWHSGSRSTPESFATQDGEIATNVGATVRGEVQAIGQQLDLMAERMGIDARDQVAVKAAMERFIDARVRGLAELVRSDSQALRGMIEETTVEQERRLREIVEERMILVGEALVGPDGRGRRDGDRDRDRRDVERMNASMGADRRHRHDAGRAAAGVRGADARHVDDRVTAIAKLVRSDNQALADRFADRGPSDDDAGSSGRRSGRSRSCTRGSRTTS